MGAGTVFLCLAGCRREIIPGRETKIAHEKWLINPISPVSSEIARENTGYLSPEAPKSTFSKK